MKNKHFLITSILSLSLLASCGVNVDLSHLDDQPNDNTQEEGESQQQEGEGEGEDVPPSSEETKYQISQSDYNYLFFNLHITHDNFLITFKENKYYVDDTKIRIEKNNEIIYYDAYASNYADYYECVDETWYVTRSTSFNVKSYFQKEHLVFPIAFQDLTYSKNKHGYTCASYQVIDETIVSDVLYKFYDGEWKSLEYDIGDEHFVVNVSNWNKTSIVLPTAQEKEEVVITDGKFELNKYNPVENIYDKYVFMAGGYRFEITNVYPHPSNGYATIKQGGYFRNIDPIENLSSISPIFTNDSINLIVTYSFGSTLIDVPEHSYYQLNSNNEVILSYDYFAIYVPIGDMDITKITFELKEGITHEEDEVVNNDIDIYFMNDIHGRVNYEASNQPGLLRATTTLRHKHLDNPKGNIMLSLGDQYQGTALSNMTRGKVVNDLMNYIGFDAQIVGNHEFDWGYDVLKNALSSTNFPTLGINVIDDKTNQRSDFLLDKMILNRNGHKIGLVGSVGDCYNSIAEAKRCGYHFITKEDMTTLVKNASNALKQSGAEFIIYMEHGNTYDENYYDITLSKDHYVDLVLNGHSHSRYCELDSEGVYHIQAGQYTSDYGHINLKYDEDEHKFTITPELVSAPYQYNTDDFSMKNLVKYYNDVVLDGLPDEVLASNASYLSRQAGGELLPSLYDHYLRDASNDLLEEHNILDTTLLALNYPILRNYISSGKVTFDDVYTALPFDNELGVAKIKGNTLKTRVLERDDYYTYPTSITSSDIDSNKYYYIICDVYNYGYSYNEMELVGNFSISSLKNKYPTTFTNLKVVQGIDDLYARDILRMAYLDNLVN